MKLWQIYVLLEKTKQYHNCDKCQANTVWFLNLALSTKTNTKAIVWYCTVCRHTYIEPDGPFVPN